MAGHALVRPKAPRRTQSSRAHTGTVSVPASEFRAWEGKGLPGEPVREMLIEAVEKRFGAVETVPAGHFLQFLSDSGSAYIAHETRRIARAAAAARPADPNVADQSVAEIRSSGRAFAPDQLMTTGRSTIRRGRHLCPSAAPCLTPLAIR